MTPPRPGRPGTNDDRGRPADRGGVRRARAADGRVALIPYVVAGYPDAETSFAGRARPPPTPGADLLEVGLPYSDPLADGATLQRASRRRAGGRRDARALAPRSSSGSAPPGPTCRSCRWATPTRSSAAATGEAVARRLAGAGAAGLIVADLTPDEGAPFEAVARERASRSSTSSPRRRHRRGGPRSPPAAAGSCIASRSSA